MRYFSHTVLLACFCASGSAYSAEFFVGGEGGLSVVQAASERFMLPTVNLRLGGRLDNGLGLDAVIAQGVSDDESAGVSMELSSQAALYIGYTGEFSHNTEINLGLGYAMTDIDVDLRESGFPGDLSYEGVSLAFRLEERLESFPSVKISGGYYHMFADDDVKIRNFLFGALYEF